MRIRSVLSLAVALAVVPCAAPAQAASDGDYQIRDRDSGRCLTADAGLVSGRLTDCGPNTVWSVRNGDDGTAQLVDRAHGCLALSPARIFPPAVRAADCARGENGWTLSGQGGTRPVSVALGHRRHLSAEGDRVFLREERDPRWHLQRLA